MRRTSRVLVTVAALATTTTAAHAQACTPAQLAANPLVALGYRALVRIDNTAFDLSCYYAALGSGEVGFGSMTPTVSVGVGSAQVSAQVNQALFTSGLAPLLNYGVASTLGPTSPSTVDFVFAFAAPLTAGTYGVANAQVGVTRASGNPNVLLVPSGAPSTLPLGGGLPPYLVAQSTYLSVTGGGSSANPFALDLGVDVGGTACTTGTACAYDPASSTPNAGLSAWGAIISYRVTAPGVRGANAQVNGQADLLLTPEPATDVLMATGLAALVGAGLVRRRSRG